MNKDNDNKPLNICTAVYKNTGIHEYNGNPLIEGLPPIYSPEEIVSKIKRVPYYEDSELNLNGTLRTHILGRLLHSFFQPLLHHIQLEIKISSMLRHGYVARNPNNANYYSNLQNGYERIVTGDLDSFVFKSVSTSASSLSLFGYSGTGKSKTVEQIMSLYPQAIFHPKNNIVQVPFVKIECPIDGDLNELCFSFFNKLDAILNTTYITIYGRRKVGTKRLLASMVQLASHHSVGILIIDEIQNLSESRSGGAAKMHNFFVSLVNTIGVPVIQIGTQKAIKTYQKTFSSARRITGFGSLFWTRLPNDSDWVAFLETLWKYQWLTNAEPLNDDLVQTLYRLSQGVIDLTIKLFVLSQARAIFTKTEKLTSKLIETVYQEEFTPVHKMITALESGNPEEISKYDDLVNIDINLRLIEFASSMKGVKPKNKESNLLSPKEKKLIRMLTELDISDDISIPLVEDVLREYPDIPVLALLNKIMNLLNKKKAPEKKLKTNVIKSKDWNTLPSDDLRYVYSEFKDKDMYKAFKNKGIILDFEKLMKEVKS